MPTNTVNLDVIADDYVKEFKRIKNNGPITRRQAKMRAWNNIYLKHPTVNKWAAEYKKQATENNGVAGLKPTGDAQMFRELLNVVGPRMSRQEKDKKPAASCAGDRIRKLRKELGLRQEDVAKMIGHSNSYVSYYERGEKDVGPDVAKEFADALGVSPSYIMTGAGSKNTLDIDDVKQRLLNWVDKKDKFPTAEVMVSLTGVPHTFWDEVYDEVDRAGYSTILADAYTYEVTQRPVKPQQLLSLTPEQLRDTLSDMPSDKLVELMLEILTRP